MPIDISIDDAALTRAIKRIEKMDKEFEPEFTLAAEQSTEAITRDMKRGVGSVTGNLQNNLVGDVKSVVGANVQMNIVGNASNGGYNYAGRLDKDGSMRWRSGKFKSYRTFGWFTMGVQRAAKKIVKNKFTKALERMVNTVAKKIK